MTPKEINVYIDVFNEKVEEKAENDEYNAWVSGMYVRDAIANALGGKKFPYPEKPYSENEDLSNDENQKEEKLQKQREAFLGKLIAMQKNFELEKARKERENGEE
jgi:hypothetical protein